MTGKFIKEAARAHSCLNTFASVVTILEGGHLYGDATAQMAAQKIIKIAKNEQQRQLRRYDLARDAAETSIKGRDDG